MIATPQDLKALNHDFSTSAWTLAAIGVLYESSLADALREPRTLDELAAACTNLPRERIMRCLDLAASVGVVIAEGGRYRFADGALPFASPPMRTVIRGEIRMYLAQALDFLDSATRPTPTIGWQHTNPSVLQSQGDASAGLAGAFKMQLVPMLGDFATRLEQPGARFLDVGVGVAALSIAMCRAWPALTAVGIDVADAPLALARTNIERAGMTDRIELRKVMVSELRDDAGFDLAWVPTFFITPSALRASLAAVHAALRPGGWMVLGATGFSGTAQQRAVSALLTEIWGGPVIPPPELEALIASVGFSTVKLPPAPPQAPTMVLAQKA
jgi:2-polyprenyl-3-methyl-5-hydroxy-6-metoxy-1,4-benzoquinol methylase